MVQDIAITIDGTTVRTTADKMVIEAASEAGIYIPYLCYHPGMTPFGACRMCVVEVEGGPGTPASCTLPVRQGMQVKTQTDAVHQIRRGITEMLLAEHPHGCLTCHRVDLCGPEDICLRHVSVNDRCVTCPKNERCELKDTTRYHQMELNSPLTYQYRHLQIETGDPFYDRDYNLCIVCGRCVRVCEEVRGDSALCFTERGGQALVGTSWGTSLLESGCEFCGACIDVCPVGALVESDYKWDKPARVERSVCQNCAVGCQMNYEVNKREKVVRAVPELNAPANHGQACFKGKFGFKYVNDKQRLRHPLVRRNGELQETTWEEALDYVASKLAQYRGNRFAALLHPRNTTEEAYLLQKFARTAMQTNNVNVSSNTRPDVVEGLRDTLGYGAATNPIWDLEQAECILVVGSNTTEEHNVVGVPIKRAVKAGTTRLIVIDPREVELTRYAHLWLRPYPGTDGTVIAGILKVVLDEDLVDERFMEQRLEGLEELRKSLEAFPPGRVSRETGVPQERLHQAARLFAGSWRSAILYALDNLSPEAQRRSVHALADLALVTGNVGKGSSGLYPLRQGANEQGAWDVGCVPHLLPGYRSVADGAARQDMERAWSGTVPAELGLSLEETFAAARNGQIKAMLVLGDHANFSNGQLADVDEALSALEFLVVQDAFLTPVAQRAHVVLPAATWAEKEGTYTNLERRIQLLKKVFQPPNLDARPEWLLMCQIAQRMGAPGFDFSTPAAVMEEIAQVTPIYSGVSHQRLEQEAKLFIRPGDENPLPTQVLYTGRVSMGLQWPCWEAGHPGTPVLYTDGFPGGKARLAALEGPETSRHQDAEYPFLFVPGRVLADPPREVEIVRSQGLNRIQREEILTMHPEDAKFAGVRDGQAVEVATADGQRLRARAQLSAEAQPGVVYATFLFGELAARLDSSEDPDPMNKVPGLPINPARVVPA